MKGHLFQSVIPC